jgi:biotin transport system substrate-specific component
VITREQPAISDRAKAIAGVAVFAALIVALGALYVPLPFTPVPVTGQTLGILLAANLLGARRGVASVALVLLLAAAGMPVLAGGRAGVGTLLGPSGGYFVGYLLTAAVLGAATARLGTGRTRRGPDRRPPRLRPP